MVLLTPGKSVMCRGLYLMHYHAMLFEILEGLHVTEPNGDKINKQIKALKTVVKELKSRVEELQDQLYTTNSNLGEARAETRKWKDRYSMIMSKVRPLVKEVEKIDR